MSAKKSKKKQHKNRAAANKAAVRRPLPPAEKAQQAQAEALRAIRDFQRFAAQQSVDKLIEGQPAAAPDRSDLVALEQQIEAAAAELPTPEPQAEAAAELPTEEAPLTITVIPPASPDEILRRAAPQDDGEKCHSERSEESRSCYRPPVFPTRSFVAAAPQDDGALAVPPVPPSPVPELPFFLPAEEDAPPAFSAVEQEPPPHLHEPQTRAAAPRAPRRRRQLRPWVWVALLLLVVAVAGGALIPGLWRSFHSAQAETDTPAPEDSSLLWLNKLSARELAQRRGEAYYYEDGVAYATDSGERAPVIALTFDDGPSYLTYDFIDELNKRGAKVTFFHLGTRVEAYPETVAHAAESGHEIDSHGWDHKNSLTSMNETQIDDELSRTAQAIYDAAGVYPLYVRPPYGNINKATAKLVDYPMMLWNVDPRDWDVRDAAKISAAIVKGAKDGAVVIEHDIYPTTVEGVLSAIDILQQQGYQFVTLATYYKIFGIEPQNGEVWRGTSQADI